MENFLLLWQRTGLYSITLLRIESGVIPPLALGLVICYLAILRTKSGAIPVYLISLIGYYLKPKLASF